MMHCMYTGATGLKTHSAGLSNVAENLANVNTVGYKQHSMLFQDLISRDLASPTAAVDGINQLGMGSAPFDVRTIFTQGAFETGSEKTDLALSGKGFFQVVSETGIAEYTRAGNFRFDDEGYLRDPSGYTLSAYQIVNGQKSESLTPVHLLLNDATSSVPAKATSEISALMNIGSTRDAASNGENPYFSLMQAWDGTTTPPLSNYADTQPMQIYDASGNAHDLQLYIDAAPSSTAGTTTYEYVIGMVNPSEDAGFAKGTQGAGLLMAGTLTFDAEGKLADMTGFTPDGSQESAMLDLNHWTPASFANGLPQFTANFAGNAAQNISLNLGIHNADPAAGWTNTPNNAAEAGQNGNSLPSMAAVARDTDVTTAYDGQSSLASYTQNGYAAGVMVGYDIKSDGTVEAQYSNNVLQDLYSIPVFRFTSEDGLRNEGKNHFTPTLESGNMSAGEAGTENYATITASKLESSNVNYEQEMVQMILVQRGFQMNSKVVTTADTMLQRAVDLKRN